MNHNDNINSDDQELFLWNEFKKTNAENIRQEIIEYYYPLARRIAAQVFSARPDNDVEFDDYYQFALGGLIEAVDRFELNREAAFSTYATYRIRGAILNGVGNLTEKREQYIFWQRQREERLKSLAENSEHKNAFEEMVELTIGVALSYMLEDAGVLNSQTDNMSDSVYQGEVLSQLQKNMAHYMNLLPERENLILTSHYFQQKTFEDISKNLNITKGRVSQLHKQALLRLKEFFEDDGAGLDLYY